MIQRVDIRPPWNDFDMLMSLNNVFEKRNFKTKKQYDTFVKSLISLLLKDKRAREVFLECAGDCAMRIDQDCKVVEIAPDIETMVNKDKVDKMMKLIENLCGE